MKGTRTRVLIADDEEDFLRFTASLFEKEGYECDCATDAHSAIEKLKQRRYDAVISDIRMPGNDDLKLVRETARIQEGVPVILVTAYPSMDTAIPAVELPVRAYVEKPVEFRELLTRVDDAILESRDSKRTEGSATDPSDRTGWFVELLSTVSDELQASKSAFKSKRLGRLRARIERIVEQLKSEMN